MNSLLKLLNSCEILTNVKILKFVFLVTLQTHLNKIRNGNLHTN